MKIGHDHRSIALEVRDLVRDYGSLRAVDHLNLEVYQGEVFGFLGPNGAGKTTAIRMMCGLLRPTSGSVIIGGRSVEAGAREVRAMVGVCPQENVLWNKLTCFEQLVFSARMYNMTGRMARERADRLLRKMGLNDKRNMLASTLSGGMKRRLNVILAIMHDPEIMVMDEPEAGLDPQSRLLVRDFIRETAWEKTVIVTTHNMDEADRIADRVAIIDSGRLIQLDTPENLKRSIGEGDILELMLNSSDPSFIDEALEELRKGGYSVLRDGSRCSVRSMNLVPKIHGIYQVLEAAGVSVSEMRIRENSLEDVFIHLTGKSLRP